MIIPNFRFIINRVELIPLLGFKLGLKSTDQPNNVYARCVERVSRLSRTYVVLCGRAMSFVPPTTSTSCCLYGLNVRVASIRFLCLCSCLVFGFTS